MEKMKKIVIMFIIIIIIIILILLLLLKNTNNNANELKNEEYLENSEEFIPEQDDNGYVDVSDSNIFYSVLNSVNKYIDIMKYNIDSEIEENQLYKYYDINQEYLFNIKNETQRIEAVYSLLDEKYKDKNNINLNNIKQFIYPVYNNTLLIPIKMKVKYGTNINTFILKTYLKGDELVEKYFVIRTNNEKQTFSIEFIDDNKNNSDIEKLKIDENDDIIEKNNYNNFKIEIIKTERIAQKHLEHYIDLAIEYPEIIYNNYLDKQYRDKRFQSLENYKKYIEDNKKELEYIQITKYFVESELNKTKYVCLDQYENTYIFSEDSVMQYNIILDTYTIQSDKFKDTYNSSDDQNKVMMNVDKFVKMLNNRDYNTAYNLLDETFRDNTFGEERVFEEYIRNKLSLHYKVEYSTFEKRGNNIFVQNINLMDITGIDKSIINFSIIMRLDEGTNFTMSFEV